MPTPPDTPASTVRGWQQDGRNIAEPVGISWYTSETRKWLAAISEANIQKSDRQFVRATEKHEREFAARGIRTIRLAIDIDQMIAWCHRDGYAIDGTGRSVYGTVLTAAQGDPRALELPVEDAITRARQ